MMKNKITGTINLTNPGLISHNEILEMYKEIVDPSFKWKNFSQEEQRKILAADRSNNYLDTSVLEKLYPDIKNIKVSVKDCLYEYKRIKEKEENKITSSKDISQKDIFLPIFTNTVNNIVPFFPFLEKFWNNFCGILKICGQHWDYRVAPC